jgi:hypothetical protein
MRILHQPISGVKNYGETKKIRFMERTLTKKISFSNHSFRDGAKNHYAIWDDA